MLDTYMTLPLCTPTEQTLDVTPTCYMQLNVFIYCRITCFERKTWPSYYYSSTEQSNRTDMKVMGKWAASALKQKRYIYELATQVSVRTKN